MPDAGTEKMQRLLLMQERLLDGKVLHKTDCADEFHVTAKTIQRDLETLRLFFAERKDGREIVYDPQARGYRLTRCASRTLTSSEVLAVCKILLDSRSMVKDEMFPILDKLVQNCAPAAQLKQVETLIANERFHYIEPHHGQKFIQSLWDLGVAHPAASCHRNYLYADGWPQYGTHAGTGGHPVQRVLFLPGGLHSGN